jgi:hypothetical protein
MEEAILFMDKYWNALLDNRTREKQPNISVQTVMDYA